VNAYQVQLPHVGLIPQVLPKVEVVRVLIDEYEWVRPSRVHSHERHYVHIPVAKEVTDVDLVAKPLRKVLTVCPTEATATTYSDDLVNVERHIAPILLQSNFATLVGPHPEVCEAPSSYWVFVDEPDLLWIQKITGKRKGQ
jgi:hypothetical protein